MSPRVAQLHPLANATRNFSPTDATAGATSGRPEREALPMTAGELWAQLRAQRERNKPSEGRNFDPAPRQGSATVVDAVAQELRELVAIVAADWPADEQAEALTVALVDPEAALTCFRALVAERAEEPQPAPKGDDRMRSCQQCANLAPSGRCLAAWRGEDFGPGIAVTGRYEPLEPDRPQRCAAYAPGLDDPDRRTGARDATVGIAVAQPPPGERPTRSRATDTLRGRAASFDFTGKGDTIHRSAAAGRTP